MSVPLFFYISDDLHRLVVNRSETRKGAQREAIHLHGNDVEIVFQQVNQRQEDLIRHPQSRNQHQRRRALFPESFEIHKCQS